MADTAVISFTQNEASDQFDDVDMHAQVGSVVKLPGKREPKAAEMLTQPLSSSTVDVVRQTDTPSDSDLEDEEPELTSIKVSRCPA